MHLPRTKFAKEIIAEFAIPRNPSGTVAILVDGMPSIPRRQNLVQFFAQKRYTVIYPRYRGSWESGGQFLRRSPHEDILDIINQLPKGWINLATGQRHKVETKKIFLFGGSFGGPAVLLASNHPSVTKVVAYASVVDWRAASKLEPLDRLGNYVKEAFGQGYRYTMKDWHKLRTGKFYNPATALNQIDSTKILLIHARDDQVVPYRSVKKFAQNSGAQLITLTRGGHIGTEVLMRPAIYKKISRFLRG